MVKLKKKNKHFKGGKTGKKGVFLQLFQSVVSLWIIELQAQYLFRNVANDLGYHMCNNIVIISMFNVSKHKKGSVPLPGNSKNSKPQSTLKFMP